MSNATNAAVVAATRLRGALEQLGDVLVTSDLNGLLVAEATLASAVAAFRTPLDPPADPGVLDAQVGLLRRALERCHRLGANFEDFIRVSSGMMTPASAYDRAGRESESVPARSLEARY